MDRWGGVVIAVYVHYHERASLSSPAAGKFRFPFVAAAYIG